MSEPDFIDQLFAPLEAIEVRSQPERTSSCAPMAMPDAPLENPEGAETELQVGHFLGPESQVAFFEKINAKTADRKALEAVLDAPYPVRAHEQYLLCGRHYLAIEEIIEPPQRWRRLLEDGRIFIPWPDLLSADIHNHTSPPALLVQPDLGVAGLIINYYIARWGEQSVSRL